MVGVGGSLVVCETIRYIVVLHPSDIELFGGDHVPYIASGTAYCGAPAPIVTTAQELL